MLQLHYYAAHRPPSGHPKCQCQRMQVWEKLTQVNVAYFSRLSACSYSHLYLCKGSPSLPRKHSACTERVWGAGGPTYSGCLQTPLTAARFSPYRSALTLWWRRQQSYKGWQAQRAWLHALLHISESVPPLRFPGRFLSLEHLSQIFLHQWYCSGRGCCLLASSEKKY